MALQYGNTARVPNAGTLQLLGAGNTPVGYRLYVAGTISNASIQVNAADGARSFNLEIRVNGVTVATLALPAGSIGADTCTAPIAVAVACGDVITTFLVRTAGAGQSTFTDESAMVEVS